MNDLVSGWLGQNCFVNQQRVPASLPRTRRQRLWPQGQLPVPGQQGRVQFHRGSVVSDTVFPLLFLLAGLRSLPLLPPLSNAVNPILGSSQTKSRVPKQLPWVSEFLPLHGAFLANLHPNLLIFPLFFLTPGFNIGFLLLLSSLLVLLLFLWLIHYPVPSGHSYFLICTDSLAASFVPSESFIPMCTCLLPGHQHSTEAVKLAILIPV